jgi:hypothetical protein
MNERKILWSVQNCQVTAIEAEDDNGTLRVVNVLWGACSPKYIYNTLGWHDTLREALEHEIEHLTSYIVKRQEELTELIDLLSRADEIVAEVEANA